MATILLVSVCLLTDPKQCKEVELQFTDEMTQMQCLMGAQVEIAKWIEAHPKWTFKKWKCTNSSALKQDI